MNARRRTAFCLLAFSAILAARPVLGFPRLGEASAHVQVLGSDLAQVSLEFRLAEPPSSSDLLSHRLMMAGEQRVEELRVSSEGSPIEFDRSRGARSLLITLKGLATSTYRMTYRVRTGGRRRVPLAVPLFPGGRRVELALDAGSDRARVDRLFPGLVFRNGSYEATLSEFPSFLSLPPYRDSGSSVIGVLTVDRITDLSLLFLISAAGFGWWRLRQRLNPSDKPGNDS